MAQTRLTKRFSMKEATLDGNTLVGAAAGIGGLDRGADVILPGFFADVLEAFLEFGFVPTDHAWEWTSLVAMPKVAKEQGRELYTECVFHGTPDAQEVKQKCQERLDNKLSVGLSIGFALDVDGYKWFTSGPELLAWAKKSGYDLKLLDVEGIQAWTGTCRALIKCAELFEYSIVPVPMNPLAAATGVKRFTLEAGAGGAKRLCTAEELPGVLAEMLAAGAEVHLSDGTRLVAESSGADGGGHDAAAPADRAALDAAGGETEEGKSGAAVLKAKYLGENVEVSVTMEAVYELTWTLYSLISQQLFGAWQWDEEADDYIRLAPPLDDALVTIKAGAQEYTDILLRVVEAIMRGVDGAQGAEDAQKALTALCGAGVVSILSDDLPAGKSFATQLSAALAAVKGCTDRGRAIHGLRLKDGRVLSQENRERLAAHRDALAECVANVDDLLTQTEPKAVTRTRQAAFRKARQQALLREAQPFLALTAEEGAE